MRKNNAFEGTYHTSSSIASSSVVRTSIESVRDERACVRACASFPFSSDFENSPKMPLLKVSDDDDDRLFRSDYEEENEPPPPRSVIHQ